MYSLYIYMYLSLERTIEYSMIRVKIFKSYDAPKFNIFNFLPQLSSSSLKKNIQFRAVIFIEFHSQKRNLQKKRKKRKKNRTQTIENRGNVVKYGSSADGNGGGGGRPLFPQWSHHVYPQFLPGSHPNANANANANANHHMNQHHHQHPLPAARHSNRQPPSNYYLPNHHSNHYNHHPNNHNYHRHHHYHHHNNNNHHHTLQKHIDQPRNLCHRNSGVGLQGNSIARTELCTTECSSLVFSFYYRLLEYLFYILPDLIMNYRHILFLFVNSFPRLYSSRLL